MSFLYPWLFITLLPLYLFYKSLSKSEEKSKNREVALLFISCSFIILSLSRPILIDSKSSEKIDSQEFIVAIDASYSMQADDLKPTRYEVAKLELKKILTKLPKNRFAMFAFTSNAILISPPTTDTQISLSALESLKPEYILTKGTSLIELLRSVSKVSIEEKSLIIFSDGGEEHDLNTLVNIAKKNKIIPYIVATGSANGAILSKESKNLKDENDNLVISRINPILEEFANLSGGKYYTLDSNNKSIADSLISDINANSDKKRETKVDVLSHIELFYFPLMISLIAFLMAVTKVHQLYVLIPLFLLPNQAESSLLDFYHLRNANSLYQQKDYLSSAKEFEKIEPSVESYYNKAVSYYKAGHYRTAIEILSKIRTTDKSIKQKTLYSMGNCAVKMGHYKRAKIYYAKALNISKDEDALYNLKLLYTLNPKEKTDVTDMLRTQQKDEQTQASKQDNNDKDKEKEKASKNSSSRSSHKALESKSGSSNPKKKSSNDEKKKTKDSATSSTKYKMGYKAYELINKGYTNEQHPW
ncbi:VWA domain-containing protein [Sulfurimonas aquatica]|uniref:VWA domain-containing protein n=1 Tax=Sulfurimonas aquatica TaxID=2672570 RepID=A0A975B1C0_9BACT|nr:VWA domain-containing protein [Sulfurimonas aquatica]QSZ42422.1 VWA domain-containing protein [Sulfurimonas aquatica]